MSIIQYIIFTIITLFCYLNNDLYTDSVVTLWGGSFVLVLELFKQKQINLLLIFILAFLYMIPTEGILYSEMLYKQWGTESVNTGYSLLITSFFLIFIGYSLNDTKGKVKAISTNIVFNPQKRNRLLLFCFLYAVFCFVVHWNYILGNILYGRGKNEYSANTLLLAISLIVLAINSNLLKNKLYTIIVSLPILIVLIATGTRLYLVYAIFMIFTQQLLSLNLKKVIYIVAISIPILVGVNFIKDHRTSGALNIGSKEKSSILVTNNINEKIASFGSSEGLIRNMAMITDYTDKNDYTYGKSTGFILYWWIPRSLWPDKPVMLDYWLIRKYFSGFSSGHSTASSYIGEVYMDFGYYLSLLISFFMGSFLATIQRWINNNYHKNFTTVIIGSFLYGWVFFGVRSILTATFMLIYILIFTSLIKRLLIKYNYLLKDAIN